MLLILPITLSKRMVCRVFPLDHTGEDTELMLVLHVVFQSNSTKTRTHSAKSSVLGVLDLEIISL